MAELNVVDLQFAATYAILESFRVDVQSATIHAILEELAEMDAQVVNKRQYVSHAWADGYKQALADVENRLKEALKNG